MITPPPVRLRAAAILLLAALALLLGGCQSRRSAPAIADGVLDLSGWSLRRDGVVHLDGAWDVYRDRLLSPHELAAAEAPARTGALVLPGSVANQSVRGQPFPDQGVVTLRLRVRGMSLDASPALRLENASVAWRLWANGNEVGSNGRVGLTRDSTIPMDTPRVVNLGPPQPQLDLVLQIANFHRGHWDIGRVDLGEASSIETRHSVWIAANLGIFGALLALGIYHIALFLLQRRALEPALVAAICIGWGIRIPVDGMAGKVWGPLAAWLPYRAILFIENSYLWPIAATCALLASATPSRRRRLAANLTWVAAALYSAALLTVPTTVIDQIDHVALGIAGCLIGYGMVTALWGLRSHRPQGAIPMTLSYAVLAATGVNDVVRGFGSPGGVNLVPIGTLVFALMQSFVVAARLTAAFRSVEALSHDLEVSNRELERKDKLKDDFLAMTSHDLRTPLHGMIGIAESLTLGAGGRLPVEVRDDLLLIAGSGRRLSILVDDILDLARLKHSDIRLEPKPVHSRGMVQTVLDTLQPLARRKSIELRNEVRDDLAPMMADEGRIYRVLYNLLGNAITHTSQGTIRVKGESRGGFMEISVADEGRGIAPEQLERIFEAYEQAGEGANERSGAGLGLAIARRLAELHGGALSVSSEVGIGSTFTLRVPVAADAPDAVAAPLRPAPDEAPLAPTLPPAVDSNSAVALRPRGKSVTGRVLVVDDEAVNVQVVANQLKLHGMEVRTASNGQDALRALHCDNPPEVVLLDVMMPGMNGLDVCRAIRQTRSMSELPVVLLTALQRREDVMRGFEAGANDYLCKPFHSEELVARVRGQLSVRKAFAMQGEKANLEKQVEDGRLAEARARLEAERATLETLRYQLNPHFLLNALASIRGAIVEAPDVARRAVSDLSAFCQLTLQRAPRTTVTVQEELEMIRLFLDLHRTRWGDYLRASTEFDESILNSSIPAWLLQPIVENALKHGSRTSPDALEVRVSGRRTSDGRLAFVVSNTGRYLAEQSRGGDGGLRVGFENIRKRLERTHPSAHTVAVRTETGWVHVELALSELTLRTEEPGQTEGHESRIET